MIRKTLFFPLVNSGSPDIYLLQGNLTVSPAIKKPSTAATWEWSVKPPKAAQGDPGKTEDSSELVYALSYAGTLGFCPYTALSQVSIAAIKHHDQKRLGEEWFIPSYTFTSLKRRQGLNQRMWGENCLLACFPWLAHFAFSHTRQNPLLWGGTTHTGLGPATSITKNENSPRLAYKPIL